MHLALPSLVSE